MFDNVVLPIDPQHIATFFVKGPRKEEHQYTFKVSNDVLAAYPKLVLTKDLKDPKDPKKVDKYQLDKKQLSEFQQLNNPKPGKRRQVFPYGQNGHVIKRDGIVIEQFGYDRAPKGKLVEHSKNDKAGNLQQREVLLDSGKYMRQKIDGNVVHVSFHPNFDSTEDDKVVFNGYSAFDFEYDATNALQVAKAYDVNGAMVGSSKIQLINKAILNFSKPQTTKQKTAVAPSQDPIVTVITPKVQETVSKLPKAQVA